MINIHNKDYLDILKSIPSNSIDLVITDPPFGIDYQNQYTKRKHDKLLGDTNNFSYECLAQESYRILKPNTAIYAFTAWSKYPDHYRHVENAGFKMKEPLIGQKRPAGTHDLYGSFQSNFDFIIFAHKGSFKFKPTQLLKNKRAGTIPNKGRKPVPEFKLRFPSCWFGDEYPWSSENSAFQKANDLYHPTIKGLEFIKWLILLSTNEGDTVCDPFLGSGTTAEACKLTNRNFIGGDIDEYFYNMSIKRINNK